MPLGGVPVAEDLTWRSLAECHRHSNRVFFPPGEDPKLLAPAKAICKICPVVAPCLEAGLFETEGVWGGLSPRERQILARSRRGA